MARVKFKVGDMVMVKMFTVAVGQTPHYTWEMARVTAIPAKGQLPVYSTYGIELIGTEWSLQKIYADDLRHSISKDMAKELANE